MYGLYSDCIWSDSNCKYEDQPKNKAILTVNNCFKIINISPLIFNFSSSAIITIELDKPLNFTTMQEYLLVIQAGDNRCTNITMNGAFINCSMSLTKSGEFNIDVSLRSDRYADTSIISAVSTEKVQILAPEAPDNIEMDVSFTVILILFLWLIINLFAFIVYFRKCNKKQSNRFKKVSRPRKVKQFVGTRNVKKFIKFFEPKKQIDLSAITRVKAQIASSTMSTLDDSTITNEPLRKRGSLWRTMRSAPRRMYQRRKLFSPKRK
uniref:Uncharacterized protein n=1 Tax=Tetranychus urticae TaxID=32264 RepID=A0A158P546_TETUR